MRTCLQNLTISLLIIFIVPNLIFGQLSFNITTDKTSYSYGETINLKCVVSNQTASLIKISHSTSSPACFTTVEFNGFGDWEIACTTMMEYLDYAPGNESVITFSFKPEELGFPNREGEQTITSTFSYFDIALNETRYVTDSVSFTAEKYLGGQILMNFNAINEDDVAAYKELYNATVLSSLSFTSSNSISETWQIEGHDIDTVRNTLLQTDLFNRVGINRRLQADSYQFITDLEDDDLSPNDFKLSEAFPNPFNPTTQFTVELPKEANVEIRLFNIAGEEVKAIYKGNLSGNVKHTFSINGEGLSSGIYFYRLTSQDYNASRKIILLK